MKKLMSVVLCAAMAVGLGGCLLPEETTPPVAQPAASAQSTSGSSQPQAPADTPAGTEGTSRSCRVLIPSDIEGLAEVLEAAAARDGIALDIQKGVGQAAYGTSLERAAESDTPPDLIWVAGQGQAQNLPEGLALLDLAGEDALPAMQGLAQLVPSHTRMLDQTTVQGLPLGYSAEGVLVDIQLLAALLNTDNTRELAQDLANCSWEEWSRLVQGLDAYLLRPGKLSFQLSGNNYNTPAYRPQAAQKLRGMFALPTADAEGLMRYILNGTLGVTYEGQAAWTTEETEEESMEKTLPLIDSMLGMLVLETMHMVSAEGAKWRSEDLETEVSSAEAKSLFTEGAALFLHGDSGLGLEIEAETLALKGRLVLVPLKMPAVNGEDEEEEQEAPAEETEEAEETTENEEEPAETGKTKEELYEEALAQANTELRYTMAGYFCVRKGAANQNTAQELLLQLFTTQEGLAALEGELRILPFSHVYPEEELLAQTANAAIANKGRMLPAERETLSLAANSLGTLLRTDLLKKEEWAEEEIVAFGNTFLTAFNLPIQLDANTIQ